MIDKITNTVFAFLIGFKLTPLVVNYDAFSNNLKGFFLSLEGSWPGGLLFAGALLGWIFYKDKKKKNKTPIQVEQEIHAYDQVGNLVVLAAIGGIGGAKLFHNLENIDELIADPIGALTGMSGLSFFGGLICGAALIVYYCRKQNIKVLHLVDATMPGLAMAYGFGRLGCQVAGDGDWGIPNDNPKPEWLS